MKNKFMYTGSLLRDRSIRQWFARVELDEVYTNGQSMALALIDNDTYMYSALQKFLEQNKIFSHKL